MALSAYVINKDYIAYSVKATMNPHAPTQVCRRQFKKGQLIKGELKHQNNQPVIVISQGGWVFPVNIVKEVMSKEIVSGADGEKKNVVEEAISKAKSPKIMVMDAAILGGIVGFSTVWLAEKRGWIPANPVSPSRNKLIGIGVGALAGFYISYRIRENKKAEQKNNKQ